jgi:UDP-glucose 4-epimerase
MKGENLSVYLCYHHAGSVGALELVDELIRSKPSTELETFLKELRNEIQADQDTLKKLMDNLGVSESMLKSATAWVMEKAGRLKLHTVNESDLGLLQSLEGLVLGITGKEGLWRALSVAMGPVADLKEIDLDRLEMRAREQCKAVEAKRLEVARRILTQ